MRHARPDYNRIQDPAGLIPDDEPVFLLRGQDVAAPLAIDAWVQEARTQGADPDILTAATDQAQQMRDWQGQGLTGCWKVPDLPAGDDSNAHSATFTLRAWGLALIATAALAITATPALALTAEEAIEVNRAAKVICPLTAESDDSVKIMERQSIERHFTNDQHMLLLHQCGMFLAGVIHGLEQARDLVDKVDRDQR